MSHGQYPGDTASTPTGGPQSCLGGGRADGVHGTEYCPDSYCTCAAHGGRERTRGNQSICQWPRAKQEGSSHRPPAHRRLGPHLRKRGLLSLEDHLSIRILQVTASCLDRVARRDELAGGLGEAL